MSSHRKIGIGMGHKSILLDGAVTAAPLAALQNVPRKRFARFYAWHLRRIDHEPCTRSINVKISAGSSPKNAIVPFVWLGPNSAE